MINFLKDNKYGVFIFIIILIVLVTLLILYLLNDTSHKILFDKHDLFYDKEEIVVGFENTPESPENIKYSFSVFIRLNNLAGNTIWNEDVSLPKYIISNNGSPNIVYYRNTGDVVVEIAYKEIDGSNELYEFKIPNFPMQRWTGIAIVVDGMFVKIFYDGKLYKAKKLKTIPWKSQSMLNIGKRNQNFNGYIGMVDYYNRPISNEEVSKLHKRRLKKLPAELLSYEQKQYIKKKENNNSV